MIVFDALQQLPGQQTERLCRDYPTLSDEAAHRLAPPLFDQATRTLLQVSPHTATAVELMNHRLRVVRGRAILECLARAHEPWAYDALAEAAPQALAYRVRHQ